MHHKLIYMKEPTWCSLAVCLFATAIIAVHVSDAFCVHLQEHLKTVEASTLSVDAIDLGRLVGYLKPSHVTHQRLLLQFLSAPEDGGKKRPKHVEQLLQLQMNILPSCITLVLSYILTYDARKPKHKIKVRHFFISWTRSVQSTSSPPITLQSILFASSHLRL